MDRGIVPPGFTISHKYSQQATAAFWDFDSSRKLWEGLYLGNTFEINYWEINGLGEIPGKSFGKKLNSIKRKIFPILRMENIKMQGTKTLYNATMDGLKMENLKKGINDLAGIDKLLVVITISLVINSLSLKRWLDCAKYNNLTNKI